MTLVPSSDSAYWSSGSARTPPDGPHHHNANNDKANMSTAGLSEASSLTSIHRDPFATAPVSDQCHDASTQTHNHGGGSPPWEQAASTSCDPRSPSTKLLNRVRIKDLIQQLRHEKYLAERVQILQRRKKILHQTISLSARLHRLHFIVQDGLVEISTWRDSAIPFKKLLQHTQDMVDVCYARWNMQLHALDPLETSDYSLQFSEVSNPVRPQLSDAVRDDLLEMLNWLRSNPAYIIRRIKALSPPRLQGLSSMPKFERLDETAMSSLANKARNSLQQRLQNWSKSLQDHAVSFERSHPWALLLFNVYGTDTSLSDPENLLRVSTWSTVLADLFISYKEGFSALAPMLFDSFASIHDWHVKDAVQLQLMDILQRGAFLLSPLGDATRIAQDFTNLADTPEARALFSDAVIDLLLLFANNKGGFPPGTLQFMTAVLAKLPTEEQQQDFRGYCLYHWFLGRFLSVAIVYPENENMLLNFHVSSTARQQILRPLFKGIADAVYAGLSPDPSQSVPPALSYAASCIVSALEVVPVHNPYPQHESEMDDPLHGMSISVCLSEVIRLLDALSPQSMYGAFHDRIEEMLRQSFQAQYSHDRFDQLRKELLNMQEPGTSVKVIHPCDEQWIEFKIHHSGLLMHSTPLDDTIVSSADDRDPRLNIVQQACLRLCDTSSSAPPYYESSSNYRSDRKSENLVKDQIRDMIDSPNARTNPRSGLFWESALAALPEQYPACDLTEDDSAILRPLILKSKSFQSLSISRCAKLETEVSGLEDVSSKIRCAITTSMDRLEDLKMKLWYSTYVMTSKSYEDAKNVSEALMNMALLTPLNNKSKNPGMLSSTRPTSSRSSASSAWRQPVNATLGALKARVEHGGPKKLSDEQVVLTESWLRDAVIENFCTGEERIHRFCMEISSTSKTIISESGERAASPVLWCNVLFSNEEAYYNLNAFGVSSAPASTRPASVSSEPYATSLRSSRPPMGNSYGTRSFFRERMLSPSGRVSGQGSWTTRLDRDRDLSHMDSLSVMGSPGPAYSVTTAESVSTFWSPRPSNPRSLTSGSVYSRPASMFNESHNHRFSESLYENTEVLTALRHKLVCLLISDLGCVVWSRGSETDAWLDTIQDDTDVNKKLQELETRESLHADRSTRPMSSANQRPELQRRESLPVPRSALLSDGEASVPCGDQSDHAIKYEMALQDLLSQMRSHVDPRKKLQAVEDFHDISIRQLQMIDEETSGLSRSADGRPAYRRQSLDAFYPPMHQHAKGMHSTPKTSSPTEPQVISQLKANLMVLKPKTLFRDLQYIAALVPQELSSRTARGEAVLHLGLAALAYKDDVCRSMVAVADKLVTRDVVKRPVSVDPPETTIKRAAEFWMIAAREGNAVAQRELGLLYLSHPHSTPVLTYPLTTASKVFGSEAEWRGDRQEEASKSSLCLALHWMTLASENGDEVAVKKMSERRATISIR